MHSQNHYPTAHIKEEWKPIAGFPIYEISNFGKVRNIKSGKCLSAIFDKAGYLRVYLYSATGKRAKAMSVHIMVASAFVTMPRLEVNHKDGNKAHNWHGNLEYVTRSENMKHAARVLKSLVIHKGENNACSKFSDDEVNTIREIWNKGNVSSNSLAKSLGVNSTTIDDIVSNRTYIDLKYIKTRNYIYNPTHKLTLEEVQQIKTHRKLGVTFAELARRFKVSQSAAYNAATGKTKGTSSSPES